MMAKIDFAIYTVHTVFWSSFGVTRMILRSLDRKVAEGQPAAPVATEEKTAPFSRVLLAFHSLAFALMYLGIGLAVNRERVPIWFSGQRIAGTVVIMSGAALMVWALVYFRSWRFRAKLEQDHELATGGPFRFLRHPLYMGLNLLALGSAIWVPTPITWAAFVLMIIGSDLRARAEETLLAQVFGLVYCEYCRHTARFVPGVY